MTTLEEMLAIRPANQERLRQKVDDMHQEARLYQLRQLRKEAGLTQAELAQRIGVSQHRISQIETGNLSSAQIGTLDKYLSALGSTLSISVQSPSGISHQIFPVFSQT